MVMQVQVTAGEGGNLFSQLCHGVEFDPGMGGGVTQTTRGERELAVVVGALVGASLFYGCICLYMQGW